jgi:PhnB protein
VDAGGKVIMPLADQFWGDRSGCVEDPFGHQWWISQRIKDMTREELRKAGDAFIAQQASA